MHLHIYREIRKFIKILTAFFSLDDFFLSFFIFHIFFYIL